MDCLLVQMPYSGLVRPSPALGLLQVILQRDGIPVETVHADLLFAAATGLELQNLVAAVPPHDLLGDWTFSHLAFPDYHPDDDIFLERVFDRNRPHIAGSSAHFRLRVSELRCAAESLLEELVELIREKHPAIVGCSSTLQQHVPSLALLRALRENMPEVVTVLGGANCEASMGHATHKCFPWVDYVFSGEADAWITPLFSGILAHGREVPVEELPPCTLAPIHRHQGYPTEESAMPRATLVSLEEQPLPDYGDYFDTLDRLPELKTRLRPSLPLETSRGCWHGRGDGGGCTFCGLNGAGKRYRSMSSWKALRDITDIAGKYGVDRVQTMDNVMDPVHVRELVPELEKNPHGPKLWYEVRTHLSQMDLLAFHRANIRWIWAGIESLDDRLLDHMGKGSTAINNVRFLKACRQAGLFVGWNLMLDFRATMTTGIAIQPCGWTV